MDIRWDVRREGRSWTADEFPSRVVLRPEKLGVWEGKLLWSHEERLALLGLLLENVGADEAAKLGDPSVWGLAWLLRAVPVPSAKIARVLLSAAFGIWASAAVNFWLRD